MAEKQIISSKAQSGNKTKPISDSRSKSLKVVVLRNRFFYMLYKNSILLFLASGVSCLLALFFMIHFVKEPVPPQYIPINADGTIISLSPLSDEKPEADVQKFVTRAIRKLFVYDYVNYSAQIEDAVSSSFTSEGYGAYLDEYVKSNTLTAVKENKWVVSVEQKEIPVLETKSLSNGLFTWDFKVKVRIMYSGVKNASQEGIIYLRVVRESVIKNADGLGISKIVFKEIK